MRIISKMIVFGLLCCTFVYFVPACSTGRNLTAFSNVWGTVEDKSGVTDENLAKLVSQLRPHKGNAEGHYQLGCWYLERSRQEEAINEFKKAIYVKPDNSEAYNGLGVAYDRRGDYAAAGYAYKMALQLNPNLAYIHNNLAYALMLQGKNNEAIDSLKQAIAMGSDSALTHNNLGLAYAFSGQFDLAMKEFEHTGNTAFAHELLAKIQYQKGYFEKAKKHYSESLALDPDSASSQKGLERSTLLAKFDTALAELKQVFGLVGYNDPSRRETPEPKRLANVGMELSNGNGVNNMAKDMGRYLNQKGFHIVRLTNADSFNHARTTLLYKREFNDATRELAEQLPEVPALQEVKQFDRPNIGMKIVLGRDLVTHKEAIQKEE